MLNLGFYNTSSSRTHVRFIFSTHAAAGANVAPNSAFENSDIRIYKATDGAAHSATQRSSANGITMTSPFDSLTGVHEVDIDLTDNTDASFYVAGFYTVVLAPDETVDSQAITGIVLAVFEIGVAKADVTQFGGTAGTFASGVPAVNATQISGDSTAADNAESFFDGTGYAGTNNVIPLVTTTTTATNLTNAPTAGDFTATMKTSITTAVPTAAQITTAVLTTAMTESYGTDGSAMTLAQAQYVTMQGITEFAISGTTKTVKKLDGSTTAYTETLDSATAPTSITRAT